MRWMATSTGQVLASFGATLRAAHLSRSVLCALGSVKPVRHHVVTLAGYHPKGVEEVCKELTCVCPVCAHRGCSVTKEGWEADDGACVVA